MQPDDEVCLCFHVTRRKLENWIRLERPQVAAQLSECFGAGTGCGWCRPFLKRLFAAAQTAGKSEGQTSGQAEDRERPVQPQDAMPTAEDYAAARQQYIRAGKGRPPGESADLPQE